MQVPSACRVRSRLLISARASQQRSAPKTHFLRGLTENHSDLGHVPHRSLSDIHQAVASNDRVQQSSRFQVETLVRLSAEHLSFWTTRIGCGHSCPAVNGGRGDRPRGGSWCWLSCSKLVQFGFLIPMVLLFLWSISYPSRRMAGPGPIGVERRAATLLASSPHATRGRAGRPIGVPSGG